MLIYPFMSSCDHAKTSLYSRSSSVIVAFSLGVRSLAIESSHGSAVVPILISSNVEAVTWREISISFSNASRALINSIIDYGSSSYSSS